jgi:(1->4)-alpha-D-glucan 1-alpha-D-glucosylmutase
VDYDLRSKMLNELESGIDVEQITKRMDSGLPKLWVAHTALCLRRDHPEWFGADAAYTPVLAEGSKSDHLVGYLRGDSVAVFVPRWPLKLGGNWASTTVELPQGKWKNHLTREVIEGGRLRVQKLLERFPVALLTREAE